MARASWRRVEDAFSEVVELPTADRQRRLAALQNQSPTLAAEVGSLLAAEGALDDFLEVPAVVPGGFPLPLVQPGERLGAYVLEQEIGRGGMGTVYLARRADEAFEKKVAIKVFGFTPLRQDLLELFRSERQILATLEHPSIARLLDGGTTEAGQPYLVMEYIDGVPLDRFIEEHQLGAGERVELLLKVAAAVEEAHRRLIVHRDIKPSNILVTADGVPHLLDFGIAKILTGSATAGDRIMTPKYASPEQLEDGPITTATDVYALGMLLAGLLGGCAAGRLETDLGCVVEKAVARNPAARYKTVGELAEDLCRVLTHRPVSARRPTRTYRLQKFIDRHRAGVAAGSLVAVVILALAVGMTIQSLRLARQRDALALEHEKAIRVRQFMARLFDLADPTGARGKSITALGLLEHGVDRATRELGDQPELQAAVLLAIGEMYTKHGVFTRAEPLLTRALALRRELHGEAAHREVAEVLSRIGLLHLERRDLERATSALDESQAMLLQLGEELGTLWADNVNALGVIAYRRDRFDEASSHYQEALALYRRESGREREAIATLLGNLGALQEKRGEVEAAEASFREAIAILERIAEPASPRIVLQLSNLAVLKIHRGELDEASSLLERALATSRQAYGELHPEVVYVLLNLGAVARDRGLYPEALGRYREALMMLERLGAAASDEYALALNRQGRVQALKGDLESAQESFQRAVDLFERVLGAENPKTRETRERLEEVRRALSASAAAKAL